MIVFPCMLLKFYIVGIGKMKYICVIYSELSISIHVTDSNKQIVRSFAHSNSFPSRLHIHYVTDNSGHYPINHLRNIAIQEVTTSHFFLTDIDIWPACIQNLI